MKTIIVPAQITTVEDRIAGSLTMTQLILLMFPLFWGTAVYSIFPPEFHLVIYKVALIVIAIGCAGTLSIRIKGRIILQWIQVMLQYNIRPTYYIANKNDSYLRNVKEEKHSNKKPIEMLSKNTIDKKKIASISFTEAIKREEIDKSMSKNMCFTPMKGGLYVSISEVKNKTIIKKTDQN